MQPPPAPRRTNAHPIHPGCQRDLSITAFTPLCLVLGDELSSGTQSLQTSIQSSAHARAGVQAASAQNRHAPNLHISVLDAHGRCTAQSHLPVDEVLSQGSATTQLAAQQLPGASVVYVVLYWSDSLQDAAPVMLVPAAVTAELQQVSNRLTSIHLLQQGQQRQMHDLHQATQQEIWRGPIRSITTDLAFLVNSPSNLRPTAGLASMLAGAASPLQETTNTAAPSASSSSMPVSAAAVPDFMSQVMLSAVAAAAAPEDVSLDSLLQQDPIVQAKLAGRLAWFFKQQECHASLQLLYSVLDAAGLPGQQVLDAAQRADNAHDAAEAVVQLVKQQLSGAIAPVAAAESPALPAYAASRLGLLSELQARPGSAPLPPTAAAIALLGSPSTSRGTGADGGKGVYRRRGRGCAAATAALPGGDAFARLLQQQLQQQQHQSLDQQQQHQQPMETAWSLPLLDQLLPRRPVPAVVGPPASGPTVSQGTVGATGDNVASGGASVSAFAAAAAAAGAAGDGAGGGAGGGWTTSSEDSVEAPVLQCSEELHMLPGPAYTLLQTQRLQTPDLQQQQQLETPEQHYQQQQPWPWDYVTPPAASALIITEPAGSIPGTSRLMDTAHVPPPEQQQTTPLPVTHTRPVPSVPWPAGAEQADQQAGIPTAQFVAVAAGVAEPAVAAAQAAVASETAAPVAAPAAMAAAAAAPAAPGAHCWQIHVLLGYALRWVGLLLWVLLNSWRQVLHWCANAG